MILNETVLGKAIIEQASREELPDGVLCRVSYPICNIGERNANNRVYEASVWEKVFADQDLKESMENRSLFGHAEHPEQTQSNLEKTCHVITDMWESDGKVWQKFDILDTPTGRIVDCLLRAECQVGCSTRAEGDLEEAEDDEGSYQNVITDSYSYKTTDFTADPSTQGAVPHNVQRSVVAEVKKMFVTKGVDAGEIEFAEKILESMQCPKRKNPLRKRRCKGCGCCEALKERKISAKEEDKLPKSAVYKCKGGCGATFDDPADVNTENLCKKCAKHMKENKTILSLLKEGIIKEGTEVRYDDKDAKVDRIEESKVTLLVGEVDPVTVAVDGNAHVNVNPAGLITILPEEVINDVDSTDVNLPATEPVEDEPVVEPEEVPEELPEEPIEDEPVVDEPVEDEIPESKEYKVGDAVTIAEGEHKDKAGKIDRIEETGITIALDDGTTVSIEDPTAVNITVTAPAPKEEVEPVEPEEEVVTEEPVREEPPVEDDELGEAKVATKGGVSDRLADGNLLQDSSGTHWVVTELTDAGLLVAQPGKAGTEKSLDWDEVPKWGFTKLAEKLDEGVKVGDTVQIKDSEGNTTPVPKATVHAVDQDTEGNLAVEVTGSEDEDEQQWYGEDKYQIILLKKADESKVDEGLKKLKPYKVVKKDKGWYVVAATGKELSGPVDTKAQATKAKEELVAAMVKKGTEFESISTTVLAEKLEVNEADRDSVARDHWGKKYDELTPELQKRADELLLDIKKHEEKFGTDESISTTVKGIKDLQIKEASTRVERDKAIELLEELTDEKQKFESRVTKDKVLEIKMLVSRMKKTLEAKENEVGALRSKLEEKAKFAAGQKKLVSETRSTSLKGITDLTESVAVEAKITMADWAKSDVKHEKALNQLCEALKVEEKKHKKTAKTLEEKIKKIEKSVTESVTEKVTEKVTAEFVKCFVEFRLSESGLKIDENSRALLENSTSLENVDNLLDEICDASRRSALHSEAIRGIHIPKHVISDPEGDRIRRSVANVMEGING